MFSQQQQRQQQPIGGTNIPALSPAGTAQASTAPQQAPGRRLRGSCDFCTRRKRKCDGDPALTQTRYGDNRCSFCIAKNQPECHYSVRLLTGPRADGAGRRASKARTEGRGGSSNPNGNNTNNNTNGYGYPGKATAGATESRGWGGGGGGGGVVVSTAMVPLKRPRLSPSPATGLIGLRENVYIGDFFQTMGFLPVTNESFIRTAMVRTMFRTLQERDPEFYSDGSGGDGEEGWGLESGGGALVPGAGGVGLTQEDTIESAAAACVLWSTIGVGCLIRGRPKSSVEGYAHLAREALSACFDDGTVETARAFTAMALLQNFMGNEERFKKYIDFAKSIVKAHPPEDVPVDLLDTHLFIKACEMFNGPSSPNIAAEDLEEAMGNAGRGGYPSCLINDSALIQQSDLCRWLLKTDIRLGACFSLDMVGEGAFKVDSKGEISTTWGGRGCQTTTTERVPPHVVYDDGSREKDKNGGPQDGGLEWGTPGTAAAAAAADSASPTFLATFRNNLNLSAEPPPPGEMSRKFAADVLPECQRMMRATNSPDVRGGIGELYFRSIMAYVFVLQGHQMGAMDGLTRCVDIFLKSPGICRFSSWKHLAHCTFACMALSKRPEKYELLRAAYNSVIDNPAETRAPPVEEWRGMHSVCNEMFCRSLYNFFMTVPSPPGGQNCEGDDECDAAAIAPTVSPAPPEDNASSSSYATAAAPTGYERQPFPLLNGSNFSSSSTSLSEDSSWARGVFDKRRKQDQPAQTAPAAAPAPAPATATATATSESSSMQVQAFFGTAATTTTAAAAAAGVDITAVAGFSGAFGGEVGTAQQPRAAAAAAAAATDAGAPAVEGGPPLGSAGPHAVPHARYGNSSSSSSVGGSAEAVVATATATTTTTATTTAAAAATAVVEEAGNNRVEQEPEGLAPLSLPLPERGEGEGAGMDLLGELDGAEAASLMDGVDLMLGEAVLEGFGEAGGEDDMLQFFEGNI